MNVMYNIIKGVKMSKNLIVDGNNIASIGYFRAKGIMLKDKSKKLEELKLKLDKESNEYKELEIKLDKNIKDFLTSFSVQIFFNIFHKYMKDNRDYRFLMTWDGVNGSKWRKEANKNYKLNRDHSTDNYYSYFIESMKTENTEADDLIYSLCFELNDDENKVISSDTDMIQLAQKFNDTKIWNPYTKKYHKIPKYDYALYKSIVGDTSDNIEGIRGYGPKRAEKSIYNNLDDLKEEQRELVSDNLQIIDLSLNPNIKKNHEIITLILKESKITTNINKIKRCFFDLKIKSFLKNWQTIAQLLRDMHQVWGDYNGTEECQFNQLRL